MTGNNVPEATNTLAKLRRLTDHLPKPGQIWCEPGSVLIVEDNPDCQKVLEDILTKADYKVYWAKDYEGAKDIASSKPAVALIDLRLPGKANGLEVGQMLKELSPGTKCILLTAYSTETTAIHAVNLNFAGYFQKPYDIGELLTLLQSILGEQRQ